jgi:hypothetical protein
MHTGRGFGNLSTFLAASLALGVHDRAPHITMLWITSYRVKTWACLQLFDSNEGGWTLIKTAIEMCVVFTINISWSLLTII